MACIRFQKQRFGSRALGLIEECVRTLGEFSDIGIPVLTLRQLYYQLVGRNVIANEERSYKNLGSLVSRARLDGQIDWDS